MVPTRRKARVRSYAPLAVVTGLALLGLACASEPSPTDPHDGSAALVAAASPLTVTVYAPDGGTPVAQATVRAYGYGADGVFGAVATATTDGAGVAILDVAPGDYCVSARTAPDGWQALNIVTPPQQLVSYAAPPAVYGPVVRARREYVPFSPGAFRYCYEELPVRVGNRGASETVRLAPPFQVLPEILDLQGQPLSGVDVFAVLPVDVPWGPELPPGVKRAFLSTYDRTASPANVVVSQGAPYALEFQQSYGPFNITGTAKGTAGNGGGTAAFAMEAAPLLCRQTLETFPAGGTGVDFTKVNYGYHASLGLLPDPTVVALQLVHWGDGPVTVTLRTDLPQGRWTTTVDYVCADGTCGDAVKKFSGGNTEDVYVYHMSKPDGSVKTTVVLTQIPPDHVRVLFAAKSPGDAIPLSSRNVASDAFFEVQRPAWCVIEESNDDKWAVGDI